MSQTIKPIELLHPSIADLDRAEELARAERLKAEDNTQCLNAFKVANMIKATDVNTVVANHKGTSKFIGGLEEQERSRRLNSPIELNDAMINASAVSELVKDANVHHIIPSHEGTNKFTRGLEEHERDRRLSDSKEAAIRRARAQRISDGIRVEGSTIRARLINRNSIIPPAAWQKGREMLDQASTLAGKAYESLPSADQVASAATTVAGAATTVAGKAYDSLPSANQVASAATQAAGIANVVAHSLADAATPVVTEATHTVGSFLSSIRQAAVDKIHQVQNSAVDTLHSVQNQAADTLHSVQSQVHHAYYGDEELHEGLSEVLELEELERHRRMNEDSFSLARHNARQLSSLLSSANLSGFQLRRNNGYNKYLNTIEERERTRRLANKSEWDLREQNAKKVSALLTALGWPFIRAAKSGRGLSEIHFLCEEERQRRLTDDLSTFYARYNARRIAALIKDTCLPEDTNFLRGHTRKLEERERKYRTKHADSVMVNANREAGLISSLGWPFFVGAKKVTLSKEDSLKQLDRLEEEERQWRMNEQRLREDPMRQLAQTNARKVARMITAQNQQKEFDSLFKQLAQQQAKSLSDTIAHDTSLLAENERKSRVNDKYMQQLAKANAYKVSSMIRKANILSMSNAIPAPAPAALFKNSQDLARPIMATIPGTPVSTNNVPVYTKPVSTLPVKSNLVASKPIEATRAAPIVAAPIPAPIAAPLPVPVAAPLPVPVAAPLPVPVAAPLPVPVAAPLPVPVAAPLRAPVAPIAAPLPVPVAAPLRAPVAPIAAPALPARRSTSRLPTPVAAPLPTPVAAPVMSAPVTYTSSMPTTTTYTSSVPTTTYTSMPVSTTTYTSTPSMVSAPRFAPIDAGFVDRVRKMYDQELVLADKENIKAASLRNKKGLFHNHRVHRHEQHAQRHLQIAKRHQEWLALNTPTTGMSAL